MAYGLEYLRQRLNQKRSRVILRYKYYDQKRYAKELGIINQDRLKWYKPVVGWCTKGVDNLADRLQFLRFDSDSFDMENIYRLNNPDVLFDSAILAALIGSCAFIYISEKDDFPRLQVIDGASATGIIDPQTNLLTEGYAVLERTDNWFYGEPKRWAYFTPDETIIYETGREPVTYENPAPYPLLVPIINRPSATRPFGHSRISRACMDASDGAMRTMRRAEITSEFYSFPQKYVTGLSQDAKPLETWKATVSSMLVFQEDEEGRHPALGQFSPASMGPHIEHLKMYADIFSGETGLTPTDLGFVSVNPTSAATIKASHEHLRLAGRKAQKDFGTGFINAGYLAACVRDDFPYARDQIYDTKVVWEPLFEPDVSQVGAAADATLKMNQAVPGYLSAEDVYQMTGIKGGGNGAD